MDKFLILGASYERLFRDYHKHDSLYIGYDFDSTVFDNQGDGSTYFRVIELLHDLKSIGCELICWTANDNLEFVANFLTDNNIPFDGINTDGIPKKIQGRKPHFSALLDDRAGLIQVYSDLTRLVKEVKNENNKIS